MAFEFWGASLRLFRAQRKPKLEELAEMGLSPHYVYREAKELKAECFNLGSRQHL